MRTVDGLSDPTRGQYDELEILFSKDFTEDIQRQLIDRVETTRGVENGAASRYSIDLVVAPHIAKVEAVVTDVLKIFETAELREALRSMGITRIRVIRGEGEWEFKPIRDRMSEVL